MCVLRVLCVLCAGFADLLGLPAISMESLLAAVLQGSSSPLLGLVHMLLLRQAQADMEYSHATGCLQVTEQGGFDLGAWVKYHRVLHYVIVWD